MSLYRYSSKRTALPLFLISVILFTSACRSSNPPSPDQQFTPQPDTPTVRPTRTKIPTITPRPTKEPSPTQEVSATLPANTSPVTATLAVTQPTGASTAVAITAQPTITSTLPAAPTVTKAPLLDQCAWVTQNIADNTQVRPGALLDVVWTVKNTGKTEWGKDYSLRFFIGPTPAKDLYYFPNKVAPDKQLDLIVSLVAPQEPGTYNSWWKLVNSNNQNFCDVNLIFIVTNSPETNTPQP